MKRLLALGILGLTLAAGVAEARGPYARYGPPPPPPEMMMMRSGPPGRVWVPGHYQWRGNRYRWVRGRWMRPPHARMMWVPGYWAPAPRGGHVYFNGYWR